MFSVSIFHSKRGVVLWKQHIGQHSHRDILGQYFYTLYEQQSWHSLLLRTAIGKDCSTDYGCVMIAQNGIEQKDMPGHATIDRNCKSRCVQSARLVKQYSIHLPNKCVCGAMSTSELYFDSLRDGLRQRYFNKRSHCRGHHTRTATVCGCRYLMGFADSGRLPYTCTETLQVGPFTDLYRPGRPFLMVDNPRHTIIP